MSINIKLYNQKAEVIGEEKVSKRIFGVKLNETLLHQVAVAQMGNERQVLADTKTRAEVRGGGKKPWRQKGTGRARAGSSRSPIWIGGGVTFGPTKDRNYKKKINKKMRRKAISMVLTDRLESNNLVLLDKFEMEDFKTKTANEMLKKIEMLMAGNKTDDKKKKITRNLLVLNDKKDEKVKFSVRNLKGVEIININNINILDLLKYKNLVLTKECVKKIEKSEDK
jgi:large subunit ribosomal protein L4